TIFVGTPTAGQVAHAGGVDPTLVNDNTCQTCHGVTSGISPVDDAHLFGTRAPGAAVFTIEIMSMTNTAPGQTPVMTFKTLKDGAPFNLLAPLPQPTTGSRFNQFTATIAGPNTDFDYANTIQYRMIGGTT